jgi:hypothetical protein
VKLASNPLEFELLKIGKRTHSPSPVALVVRLSGIDIPAFPQENNLGVHRLPQHVTTRHNFENRQIPSTYLSKKKIGSFQDGPMVAGATTTAFGRVPKIFIFAQSSLINLDF